MRPRRAGPSVASNSYFKIMSGKDGSTAAPRPCANDMFAVATVMLVLRAPKSYCKSPAKQPVTSAFGTLRALCENAPINKAPFFSLRGGRRVVNISRLISLIVFFMRRHGRGQACWRLAACVALALASSQPSLAAVVKTIVRMETNLGSFNIGLYDDDAPETVKNFLNYVNRGDYDNSIIHRSVPGFVVQGGGYKCCDIFGQAYHILTDPPVLNEFDPSRSNIRGTIAMAKLGDDPDSATSEWFFNLADNHDNLDNQNGGFPVFARVLDAGMDVVDAIAVLPIISVP